MQTKFIVSHNGQELGPYTREQIQEKLAKGEFQPLDYAFDDAKDDWVSLTDFMPASTKKPAQPPVPGPAPYVQVHEKPSTPPPILHSKQEVPTPPTPVTAPTTPPPHTSNPTLSPVLNDFKGATIKIVGGQGKIDLTHAKTGRLNLKVVPPPTPNLKAPSHLEIEVRSGAAEKITWNWPVDTHAGKEVHVQIEALDNYGNRDTNFNHKLTCSVHGPKNTELSLNFERGYCQLKWTENKAGDYKIDFKPPTALNLKWPPSHQLKVKPGTAHELIIEQPKELVAGQSAPVIVRAVDAYGNLATDFTGTVELKAS